MRFAIVLLVTVACWGQQPPKSAPIGDPPSRGGTRVEITPGEPPAKPAPVITVEQQAEWLQARGDLLEAQAALTAANARMQAIVTAMQAVCPLQMSKTGRPECVPEKTKEKDK